MAYILKVIGMNGQNLYAMQKYIELNHMLLVDIKIVILKIVK